MQGFIAYYQSQADTQGTYKRVDITVYIHNKHRHDQVGSEFPAAPGQHHPHQARVVAGDRRRVLRILAYPTPAHRSAGEVVRRAGLRPYNVHRLGYSPEEPGQQGDNDGKAP